MVFSSVTFLFLFLPIVILAYCISPRRARNAVLVVASLLYYHWGAGSVTCVLLASIAANYVIGFLLEQAVTGGRRSRARLLLGIGVVGNVAVLGWFKYANFGLEQANALLGTLGAEPVPWMAVLLPIGISFYTFHSLSYLVDIYRRVAPQLLNPIDFTLYITFFPQLIAGPIVRFHEIRDQLVSRVESGFLFSRGATRFAHGLGKKVLIADTVAPVANAAFSLPPSQLDLATCLIGLLAVSDAFPLRAVAIRAYSLVDYGVLGGSTTPQVTVGRDGWLFFTEDVRPVCRWTPSEVATTVGGIGQALAASGRDLWFTIVPGKDAVYPGKLRPDLPESCTDTSRAELRAAMDASGGSMIDLWEPTFAPLAADPDTLAYFSQDTHWTPTGALPSIEKLVRAMDPEVWDTSAVVPDGEVGNLGDLSVLVGLPKIETVPNVAVRPGVEVTREELAVGAPLESGRSVEVFRAPGPSIVAGGTLFIYDSTFGRMKSLISPWFETSIWIHIDDLTLHPEVVAALPPYKHVVLERIERGAYLTDFEFVMRPIIAAQPRD